MDNENLVNLRKKIIELSKQYIKEQNDTSENFVPYISNIPVTGKPRKQAFQSLRSYEIKPFTGKP